MNANRTKLTVSLPDEDIETINKVSARLGLTKTDVIRRALALEKFYVEKTGSGSKFIVEDPDKRQQIITFL